MSTLNARSHSLSASYSGDTSYYTSASTPTAVTIAPAALTITANDVTATYADGSTLDAYNGFTVSGLQGSDTLAGIILSTNASLSGSSNWNVGNWTIAPSAAFGAAFDPNNYSISYVNGGLTVNPASLGVAGVSGTDKVYDGGTANTISGMAVLVSLAPGDNVTLGTGAATASFTDPNAGTAKDVVFSGYTISGADAGNYTLAQPADGTADITPATPIITWSNPADIAYATPLSSTQLDASANVPGSFVYTPAAGSVLNAGSGQTLSVTFTPSDTVNYTSATQTVAINVDPPAGTLASSIYAWASESPANLGDAITLSANVSGSGTPTGTVTFIVNGVAIGTAPVDDMMGGASVAAGSLAAGNYTVTVIYSGDDTFASSTTTSTLTVNQGYAMLSSDSNSVSADAGQTITLSVSVIGLAAGFVPTGTVTFTLIDSNNNQTALDSETLDGSGNASLSTSIDTPGTYEVEISYSGDANYQSIGELWISITIN